MVNALPSRSSLAGRHPPSLAALPLCATQYVLYPPTSHPPRTASQQSTSAVVMHGRGRVLLARYRPVHPLSSTGRSFHACGVSVFRSHPVNPVNPVKL